SFDTITVFLGEPVQVPVALSANNDPEEGTEFQEDLVVRFPYPIEVCSDLDLHSARIVGGGTFPPFDGPDGDGDTTVNSLDDDDQTTFMLDETNTVLTLSFVLDATDDASQTDPVDMTNDALSVSFVNFQVSPVGASTCQNLTNVEIRNTGRNVSNTIDVR
ncbi:MAG: hypothetical protein AAF658_00920, partial [Myxococcota bacterium]